MKLGILYKDGKIVNHRSFIKVLFNPILRYFGYYIGTVCENEELRGIQFKRGQRTKTIIYDFKSYNDYDKIVRKRIFI